MSRNPPHLIALVAWLSLHFDMIEFVGRPKRGDGWNWIDLGDSRVRLDVENKVMTKMLNLYNDSHDAFLWCITPGHSLYVQPVAFYDGEEEAVP